MYSLKYYRENRDNNFCCFIFIIIINEYQLLTKYQCEGDKTLTL